MKNLPELPDSVTRLLVLAIACFVLANQASAGEGDWSYVLLKAANETEQIQEGVITDQGSGYEIRLGEKSRMWIPRHRVLFVGKNIEEVYQFKRKRIVNWSGGDHFQMSRWCMQYDLISEAAEHYQQVAARYPDHASVKQLAVELKKRMLDDEGFREYLGIAPAPEPTRLAMVKPEGDVAAASGTDDAAISVEARQRFASRIQPILRNRCSQAACHGYRSPTELKLFEPYGENASRTTSRNLSELLEYTKFGPRGELPALLHYATTAHGSQREPGVQLNEHALIYELQLWIRALNGNVIPAVGQPSEPEAVIQAGGALTAPTAAAAPAGAIIVDRSRASLNLVPGDSTSLRSVPVNGDATDDDVTPRPHAGDPQLMSEIELLDQQLRLTLGEAPRTTPPGLPQRPIPPPKDAPAANLPVINTQQGSADPFDAATFNSRNHR